MRKTIFGAIQFLSLLMLAAGASAQQPRVIPIKGRISVADSLTAAARATIRIAGTSMTTVANDDGLYQIKVPPGTYTLQFSHVAHYSRSESVTVTASDTAVILDISLQPALIVLPGTKVYERSYDAAQSIIIEAIRRKNEILSRVQSYRFDAYTKLVVKERKKDDSVKIVLITETQLTRYWEQPDNYKEIITARRQTANLEADQNLVGIGEILDFNLSRLDIGRYSVVSPTATDALDHYNYYLIDTLFIDSQAVFRLEIEPKSDASPLFVGTIDIADSTFAVMGVDVGFNKAFDTRYLKDPRYSLRYQKFERDLWLPIEIRLTTGVELHLPGIPNFDISYLASCYNYAIDTVFASGLFDEFVIEVAPGADEIDSTDWADLQAVPMTFEEQVGYRHIDSVTNAPKSVLKKAVRIGLMGVVWTLASDDFFHFNRVEGFYLGLGIGKTHLTNHLFGEFQTGYAEAAELWQNRVRLGYDFQGRSRPEIWLQYRDQIVKRPTVISPDSANPTITAIFDKTDQFDYYREKGFSGSLSVTPIPHWRISLTAASFEQTSADTNTQYSIAREKKLHAVNPPILDGDNRYIGGEIRYDSRKLIRNKHRITPVWDLPMTIAGISVRQSSPDILDSDFDYRRFAAWFLHSRRILGVGYSSLFGYAGGFDGALPPQEYFMVDFGNSLLSPDISFKTMGESYFGGSRTALLYWNHSFGTSLFQKSKIPLVENIPFGLSTHAGVFWSDLGDNPPQPGDDFVQRAHKPYAEAGFGLTRLLPLNLKVIFTWRLSDYYDTEDFSILIGGEL